MWYPPKVTTAATAEPVTLDEVKRRLRVTWDDEDDDIKSLIASARDYAETYCNTPFVTRTVEVKCDCWNDMARLSIAPVQSITSISYVDTAGASQTVDPATYEPRLDGLEASIRAAYAKQWPVTQPGSRITVVAVVGYAAVPDAVKHAHLIQIADAFENRENDTQENWTAFDALLCNFRRG